MRIALVIYDLNCGGAQRVMVQLANQLAAARHTAALFTLLPGTPFFKVDSRVTVSCTGGITPDDSNIIVRVAYFIKRFLLIRKSILNFKPDVVLSFVDEVNVRVLMSMTGTGIPVIVSEHTYPPNHSINPLYAWLRKKLYPKASAVVVLTKKSLEWTNGWVSPDKAHVIPNFVEKPHIPEDTVIPFTFPQGKVLVAAGRLSHEKGYDMLIESFSKISKSKYEDWTLLILGSGPEEISLRSIIKAKNLETRVLLPGTVPNISAVLTKCHLFALSSRYEGFPTGLCDAMACGLPCVCFDCDTGPGDIITDGVDGILVPPGNVEKMANVLKSLMDDEKKRTLLGTAAKNIVNHFSTDIIMRKWEELFRNVTHL